MYMIVRNRKQTVYYALVAWKSVYIVYNMYNVNVVIVHVPSPPTCFNFLYTVVHMYNVLVFSCINFFFCGRIVYNVQCDV